MKVSLVMLVLTLGVLSNVSFAVPWTHSAQNKATDSISNAERLLNTNSPSANTMFDSKSLTIISCLRYYDLRLIQLPSTHDGTFDILINESLRVLVP